MSIANAGVVFQQAKEEKADPVENGTRLILFLFRLFFYALYLTTCEKSTAFKEAPPISPPSI